MEPHPHEPPKPQAQPAEAPVELSEREREILVLVASGASNKEVAQRLVISPNTVKVHLRNIFGKISVSSRTEAALYAVRAGLVRVAVDPPAAELDARNGVERTEAEPPATVIPLPPQPEPVAAPTLPAPRARPNPLLWLGALLVVALLATTLVVALPRLRATPTPPPPSPTAVVFTSPPRWQPRGALPTSRSRLAAVAFENQVYAIGGETEAGVTGLSERYNPTDNTWSTLAEKPVAVADAGAAVVGGLIYVPGGRLASGELTTTVEAYDPAADEWSTRAPLPEALSAYALAAFEGRLYVFGGWNGDDYVANVYEYDPATDAWLERTRMPTARGFAAAAPAGGKIYVIGGTDRRGASPALEAYVPARDSQVANPWESLAPAPASPAVIGAAAIADTVYVAGSDETGGSFQAWEFQPAQNVWEPLEQVKDFSPNWFSVVGVQTHVYVLGAPRETGDLGQMVAYQALYTSLIPVIPIGE